MGMSPAEYRTIFGPAAQLVHEFGGEALQELLSQEEGPLASVGTDPNLIRALGRAGEDFRVMQRDHERLESELKTMAAQLGESLPAPKAKELTVGQYEAAIKDLVDSYLTPEVQSRLKAAGFFDASPAKQTLQRMAIQQHQRQQTLVALTAMRDQLRQRARSRDTGPTSWEEGMSRSDLQSAHDGAWQEWREAEARGDRDASEAARRRLNRIAEQLYR